MEWNIRKLNKRQKIWLAIGGGVFCGMVIFLPIGLVLVIGAVITYCVVSYYAAAERSQR